jgi:lysyl-tRNA synthetase class 2
MLPAGAIWLTGHLAMRHSNWAGKLGLSYSVFGRRPSPAVLATLNDLAGAPVKVTLSSPWWTPGRHRDRRPLLLARARIKARLRAWLEAQGFVEVETACLQVSPGNETHLHAFGTELVGTALDRHPLYLHTSPEFAMKKLLAAGEERIFTFAPCFRNRERGALHSPEFTMLEWYRAGAPYERLWEDCAEFLKIAADETQRREWTFGDKRCDVATSYDWLTLDQAFSQFAGIALHESYSIAQTDRDELARQARARGIKVADDDTWSDIFSRVLVEKIEPNLGLHRPKILCEYPVPEAALARPIAGQPGRAERFELYVCGVELANGFGELQDAAEQRRRFATEMSEKQRIYGERYPIDEDFLAALDHMPAACGCALGFDRLVMLATGAQNVDQVIWTPLADEG